MRNALGARLPTHTDTFHQNQYRMQIKHMISTKFHHAWSTLIYSMKIIRFEFEMLLKCIYNFRLLRSQSRENYFLFFCFLVAVCFVVVSVHVFVLWNCKQLSIMGFCTVRMWMHQVHNSLITIRLTL